MLKKVVFLPTILIALYCMTALFVPAHSYKNKSKVIRAAFDYLTQVASYKLTIL
jgi:hypothetical protein